MMVLVASQCCPASERLLAVGKRAFIRAFAGMNATVSCEGTGITERLEALNVTGEFRKTCT